MLERIGFRPKIKEQEITVEKYKQQIAQGLDFNGAGFLKTPKEVEQRMLNEISSNLIEISGHLRIPLPQVGLIHGWNQKLHGYTQNHEIREVLANASVDNNHPDGIIRFSPFYIKSEITYRMGIDQRPALPFGFIIPHENFHIWQYHNQYEQVTRDCQLMENGGLSAWAQTKTEIEADEFAKSWILRN